MRSEDVTLGGGGSGDTFSWAFDLPEGQTVVQLYAEDSGGQSAVLVHEGPQTLTVSAQDSLGHSASFPVSLSFGTIGVDDRMGSGVRGRAGQV